MSFPLDDGTRKYVWGLGLAYAVDTLGNPLAYHTDGLDSVRDRTDATGVVVRPFQYRGKQRDDKM